MPFWQLTLPASAELLRRPDQLPLGAGRPRRGRGGGSRASRRGCAPSSPSACRPPGCWPRSGLPGVAPRSASRPGRTAPRSRRCWTRPGRAPGSNPSPPARSAARLRVLPPPTPGPGPAPTRRPDHGRDRAGPRFRPATTAPPRAASCCWRKSSPAAPGAAALDIGTGTGHPGRRGAQLGAPRRARDRPRSRRGHGEPGQRGAEPLRRPPVRLAEPRRSTEAAPSWWRTCSPTPTWRPPRVRAPCGAGRSARTRGHAPGRGRTGSAARSPRPASSRSRLALEGLASLRLAARDRDALPPGLRMRSHGTGDVRRPAAHHLGRVLRAAVGRSWCRR